MASNYDKDNERVTKDKGNDTHRRSHKIKVDDGVRHYGQPAHRTVHVRIRYGGRIQVFDCADMDLDIGDWVIIRDFDVMRMGLVTTKPIIWPANQASKKILLPTERFLIRPATEEDLAKQAENQLLEREGFDYCQACISHQKLVMKLVAVEVTFDHYKTIFYYTAGDRVDFRLLVKELVRRFRTRIEMRQIGVRHEALILGGMGVCGRPFCCSGFLSNFNPVSVKMAKEQNLNLNTVKISGVCGRLMCCLAFENFTVDVGQDYDDAESLDSLDESAHWPTDHRQDSWQNQAEADPEVNAEAALETAEEIKWQADLEPEVSPRLRAEIKAVVEAEAYEAMTLAKEINYQVNKEKLDKLLSKVGSDAPEKLGAPMGSPTGPDQAQPQALAPDQDQDQALAQAQPLASPNEESPAHGFPPPKEDHDPDDGDAYGLSPFDNPDHDF
jgi:cell fate regulator YaaT (PSP1 superfamily)